MLDISGDFSFEKSKAYAEKLDVKYPFLTCSVIGRSCSGRGVFAFSAGSVTNSVVITATAEKPDAQTSLVLYKYIDSVCESVFTGREISGVNFASLIKKFGITVIPCLNPDTSEKGNILSDFSDESSPEMRAFSSLCHRRHYRSCLTLRNGRDSVFCKRKELSLPTSQMMAKILSSSCLCPACESEMPPCPSRWFIDLFSKPAFLMNVRRASEAELLYKRLEESLVLMSVM